MKNTKIRKTVSGGNGLGLRKYLISLPGNVNTFDTINYAEKLTDLQSNLEAILKPHKKTIRLFRCFGCQKNYKVTKMSSCLAVCRECYRTMQSKGKTARNNFVEKTVNNLHKFLRGGMAR